MIFLLYFIFKFQNAYIFQIHNATYHFKYFIVGFMCLTIVSIGVFRCPSDVSLDFFIFKLVLICLLIYAIFDGVLNIVFEVICCNNVRQRMMFSPARKNFCLSLSSSWVIGLGHLNAWGARASQWSNVLLSGIFYSHLSYLRATL